MARSSTTRKKGDPALPGAGRPKTVGRIRELALEQDEANIRTLVEIRDNPEEPAASRVAAVNAILDRAHGKPPQSINVRDMSDEELLDELRLSAIEAGLIDDDQETEAAH